MTRHLALETILVKKKKRIQTVTDSRHENMWRSIGRQEEPAIVNSRLLLRMRRVYVASIRLYFH